MLVKCGKCVHAAYSIKNLSFDCLSPENSLLTPVKISINRTSTIVFRGDKNVGQTLSPIKFSRKQIRTAIKPQVVTKEN